MLKTSKNAKVTKLTGIFIVEQAKETATWSIKCFIIVLPT